MSENNTEEKNLAFSQDVKATIRLWMADPDLQPLVFQAIEEGPAENTSSKLGYCNIGSQEQPEWKTIFGATNREKKIGEKDLFYKAQKSGMPLMRLRHQKAQTATSSTKDDSKVVSAKDISLDDLAAASGMTKEQILAVAGVNAAKPEPQKDDRQVAGRSTDDSYEVPAHVAAIIAKTRI